MPLKEFDVTKEDNVLVVFGSESTGIENDLNEITNANVYIPPNLDQNSQYKDIYKILDSLNAGVSAGIIINHIKQKLI